MWNSVSEKEVTTPTCLRLRPHVACLAFCLAMLRKISEGKQSRKHHVGEDPVLN